MKREKRAIAAAFDGFSCVGTNDPAVVALQIKDVTGREFTTAADVMAMAFIAGRLLETAANPMFAAASLNATKGAIRSIQVGGASRIEWRPGPTPDSTFACVTFGALELQLQLPLATAQQASAALLRMGDQRPTGGSH